MADLSAIIKVENKSTLHHDILRLFTVLGDEPTLYPCNASILGESHYFLEYRSSQAAAHACHLGLGFRDIRILPLGQHPYLYHQYRLARELATTSDQTEDSNPNGWDAYSRGSGAKLPLADVQRRCARGSGHRSHRSADPNSPTWTCITPFSDTQTILGDPDGLICSGTPSSLPVLQAASGASQISVEEVSGPLHQAETTLPSAAKTYKRTTAHNSVLDKSEAAIRISALDGGPSSATLPISCDTTVAVNLFDHLITYDLKANDSDPRVLIELLKVAQSERSAYLTAAAFYRRSGNPQSAKAVLTSMLEEFAARGVGADQLKPALLYLSGCELELAKLAKAEKNDSSVVSKHYAAAQIWLQKVFGVRDHLRVQPQTTVPPLIRKEEPFKGVNNTLPSKPRDRPSKPIPDRDVKRMEREIQSLHDRNANQVKELSQLRSTKRKLEDDYSYERNLRRKYQRQRDVLEEERNSARKMEKHVLEQITREVAARRKAQETVVEMKAALGRMEGPKTKIEQ